MIKKYTFYISLFLSCSFLNAQKLDASILEFEEYLGYVKKFHPIAKQADLLMQSGQAKLMKSRGGFDPKIEVDFSKKEFKGTTYYDKLNATFKIPTWYGIDVKGSFSQNDGTYLNPEYTVPEDGLYSAGLKMSIGQGLWINDRMATLKKAKFYKEQSKADREITVNQVLYDASIAYFNWLQAYNESLIFENFYKNAQVRFSGIKRSAELGQIATIDTVEAKITIQNRALSLEQAKLNLIKSKLELSSFLWLNDVPIELQETIIPDQNLVEDIDVTLEILGKPLDSFTIENHPKLKSYEYKIKSLTVDKNLKANKLLPKIDVEYNFLTETPGEINSFETEYYKGGINFQLPLFLRKERGDLKLAKYKLQDAKYDKDNVQLQIRNKIVSLYTELDSFEVQNEYIFDIVTNYRALLAAEERKFSFGESSVFLINSRESKLIDAELKQNQIQNKFFTVKAKLFNSLALSLENL
ncbi:TolC family protein [Cellulophaga baltica]|uniref:TolC family protein n=1 Tax=Cellulophaga TaxID=104264 RepID=UPI001C0729EE|nr:MULTISPECIES: TolC family protein [Cellulophaga]MBU2995569.1 TolC family protein [Cellulophaga baltica]MDO6766963.1 TolC family protein [Cellulophaga sp. 1_MG-2023]